MAPQAIKRSGMIIEAAQAILWLSPDWTLFRQPASPCWCWR